MINPFKSFTPQFLVISFVLILGSLSISGYFIYQRIYSIGYNDCKAEYDQILSEQETKSQQLEDEYRERERKYQQQAEELTLRASKEKETYLSQLSAVERAYSDRLRQSENRARVYEQMSRGSTCSVGSLAAHAARLDRKLTEGRRLVTDLRNLIELRDSQLRTLGEELKLLGQNDADSRQDN